MFRNGVRYDLPAFGDVSVALGYANDQIYDVAVKYSGKLGGLTTNIHAGYATNAAGGSNVGGTSSDTFQIQVGLMDPASGWFGLATLQTESAEDATAGSGDDTDAYYFKIGKTMSLVDAGDTAVYGELATYNDQYGAANADGVTGSEIQRLGLAVDQKIGTRMIMYAKWEQLSLDVEGSAAARTTYGGAEDLSLITFGVVYHF